MQLFAGIASANDVNCDVASNSTFVYAYGFAEDIDASHALYASLVMQMVRPSEAYLSSGAHRPTPTITARLNFQLAFGARVGRRLAEAREEATREATKDRRTAPGTALALRNKDVELKDHYRRLPGARHLAGHPRHGRLLVGGAAGRRQGRPAGAARATAPNCRCPVPADSGDGRATRSAPRSTPPRNSSERCSTAPPNTATALIDFFGTQLTLPPEAGSRRWSRCNATSTTSWPSRR